MNLFTDFESAGFFMLQVSCLKCGLLPISQEAAIVGDISYHDYHGILVDPTEKDLIIRNLGPFNKVTFFNVHVFKLLYAKSHANYCLGSVGNVFEKPRCCLLR